MELTKEDRELLERAVGRALARFREREEARHIWDMTDEEYAKAEKAASRKRDAGEDWE